MKNKTEGFVIVVKLAFLEMDFIVFFFRAFLSVSVADALCSYLYFDAFPL